MGIRGSLLLFSAAVAAAQTMDPADWEVAAGGKQTFEVASVKPGKAPKWIQTEPYEIEARAEGNPTKDQMRLMMQSLLADRFQLAIHFTVREVPILALTLVEVSI